MTARRVVVVGAGIAGLAAAYAVRRDAPPGTQVTVVDGARAPGGKLRTGEVAGQPVDEGAEAFLARGAGALALVREIGLGDQLVEPATTAASVVVAGRLRPLPARTLLGVPADLDALAACGVLSPAGLRRVRAGGERPAAALTHDVAVGALVRGRLGDEVVQRLVDPLLGGVYAGRADALSLEATMPGLLAPLRAGSSLVAAARAALGTAAGPDGPTGSTGPVFAGLRGGMAALPARLVERAAGELLLGLPVREIQRLRDGRFRLVAGPRPRPVRLAADAVVVAVPAAAAGRLLSELAPAAAAELAGIDYASVATVTLAYPSAPLPAGSGLLVPAGAGRAVKAVTFVSQKWSHLRSGPTIVRASVGRYGEQALLQRSDEDLAALVGADVAALTGLSARPIDVRVTRWGGALPQYAVGHPARVRRIRAAVERVPGLAVAGAAYDGVGIPACIRSGYAAAARVVDHLAARERTSERIGP